MWNENNTELDLIESSFMMISESLDELSSVLFKKLYEKHPEFESIFYTMDVAERNQQFVSLIDTVVSNIRNKEIVKEQLQSISKKYSFFKFTNEHADAIESIFLETMHELLGDNFNSDVNSAWKLAFDNIIDLMNEKDVKEIQPENIEVDVSVEKTEDVNLNKEESINVTESQEREEDSEDEKILEDGFEKILSQKEIIADRFHEVLFEKHPELKDLFGDVNATGKKQKLIDVVSMVNESQDSSQHSIELIRELGKLYQSYGAIESHYPAIRESLISVLQELCGEAWTEQIDDAWTQALIKISKIMLEAYEYPPEANTMSNDVNNDEIENLKAEVEKLRNQCHMDQSVFDAIDRIRAVVEYDMQGNILKTNQIFLDMMGYSSEQVAGKHHSMFVSGEYSNSAEYREFWAKLNRGEIDAGQYKYVNSQGKDVWIQAYYAPVNNIQGSIEKVIIYATDITEQKLKNADYEGQMAAIGKSQGVIEFNTDGTIIWANDNFLSATGYSLQEIQGQHHRMFVETEYANSYEYKEFWNKLGRGEYDSGEYKRIRKDGKYLFIQASYNPIFDLNGKPIKVVKYASDITEQVFKNADYKGQLDAINKSQGVIEFNMDGTVIWANDNFLSVLGYSMEEINGKHHSMFATPEVANSIEYKQFWEKLNRGEFDAGEYQRFGKGGKEIWIQASYNPILDLDGKPYKVVKYASDITEQKLYQQSVEKVLAEVSNVMQDVSNGDLTQSIDSDFGHEFNEVRDTVNATVKNLFNMVNEIRNSSGNINTSAQEIAQGNTDLSARTEQQASALEETASTVEEMTGTVRQNADNAKQADQLASNARDTAEKGGDVVTNAIGAMSEINSSSKKIADIIGVIDEIAFQTNLLALNAAVEAARAGEQGRGFAVVASEVRNLAQRSAAAAKEIKTLINDSVDKVEEGSKLVDESGQTLEEIVSSVKKVSDIIAEIAAAGEEQYVGIEQINKAVGEMDQMTQQNAALVEEAAAASQAMSEQSQSLNKLVSQFNVGEVESQTQTSQLTERRSENRPWNNGASNSQSQAPAPSYLANKVAAAGGDDEWEEF